MLKPVLLGAVMLAVAVDCAIAQQREVKIGFVTTLSGGPAAVGNDMRDAFELALDHLGRKMSGLAVQVIYEDDGLKPELGKQKTDRLIESEKVNFLTGYMMSQHPSGLDKVGGRFEYLPHQRKCRTIANRGRTLLAMVLFIVVARRPGAPSYRRIHEPKERQDGLPDRAQLCGWQGRDSRAQGQLPRTNPR
jgi:hypothetical protein